MACQSLTVAARIPAVPEPVQSLSGKWRKPVQIELQKCVELGQMGVVFLLIDVPEHRSRGPLGANERIFAAHHVEIAAPQQPIVVFWRMNGST